MATNQVLMTLFNGTIGVDKVINMDQVKYAEEGSPVTIDQVDYDTTIITFMDATSETALISFALYKVYHNTRNMYIDYTDNGIPNPA